MVSHDQGSHIWCHLLLLGKDVAARKTWPWLTGDACEAFTPPVTKTPDHTGWQAGSSNRKAQEAAGKKWGRWLGRCGSGDAVGGACNISYNCTGTQTAARSKPKKIREAGTCYVEKR